MASKPLFTDEEILYELRKLGYEEVPDALFSQLKEELENITASEISPSTSSSPHSNTYSPPSSSLVIPKDIAPSVNESKSEHWSSSSDKENHYSHSFSSTSEIIKRKTLRRINGQPIITEDVRIIPTKTKRDWDNDVKIPKSNNGDSLFESSHKQKSDMTASKNKISTKTSSISLSKKLPTKSHMSKRGVLLPKPLTNFNKKNDPVARYHEYKKFWDTLKNPGEDKRNNIRWAIRDKLLDYDFL